MKNILRICIVRYHNKAITIIKVSLAIVLMSFIAYTKPSSQPDGDEYTHEQEGKAYKSSVSIVNGHYKIDSNIIENDRNKSVLLDDLKTEDLIRKTATEEIPEFILAFLAGTLVNKKFEIANPWEKWKTGDIMDLVVIPTIDMTENLARSCNTIKELPDKRLVYFGLGDSIALLSYHTGGIRIQQHIVIVKFQKEKIVDFWYGTYLGLYINTRSDLLRQLNSQGSGDGSC